MSNFALVASALSSVSLGDLAVIFNAGVAELPLDGFSPVKKFASKAAGSTRIEKFLEAADGRIQLQADVREDGTPVFIWLSVDQSADGEAPEGEAADLDDVVPTFEESHPGEELPVEELDDDSGVEDEAAEEPAAEAPFVKLSKAELDALGERGSPAREAYRKARRAAARQARKAKGE